MHKKVIIAASAIAATAIGIAMLMPFVMQSGQTQIIPSLVPPTANDTFVTQSNETQTSVYDYEVRKITIDDVMLDVEIADDSEKTSRGLMFREMLPENRGMLFIFDEERKYQFWMMNMKFNIDMIWLDASGKVVHIVEDAAPCIDAAHTSLCTFSPDEPAKYVLEVNSGFVQQHGINENSVMRILT